MKEDIHRHLDGELPEEGLGEESRREAEAWGRLLGAFRTESPGGAMPPWLETRVMAEIEALPEPGTLRRALNWVLSPRPVSLSPLTTGLVAIGLMAILLVGRQGIEFSGSDTSDVVGPTLASLEGEAEGVVYVQFVLDAPGAASVAVTGDFDGWEGTHGLEDLNGDGVWSGRVAVQPGVHSYMFLVDGSTWMTDPRAERYSEDGFGNRNAILAVATPTV
jgi:hypothetical protein